MENEIGVLYIVATPIGNLDDITLRAINVLEKVDLIAAEDTRHSLKLLNHLKISKPLISYHRHNEETKTDVLIKELKMGKNIALVSDAGTPGISDPGEEIVKEAIEREIQIIPIPGACALINALICSGLETSEFCFLGFLPLNKKNRNDKIMLIQKERMTTILYEAPHKLKNTLQELKSALGERKIVIAKELTKIHEEFMYTGIDEIINSTEELKGEYVIIIEGNKQIQENDFSKMDIKEHYLFYENQGLTKNEIIKQIAKDRNVHKSEIYKLFI